MARELELGANLNIELNNKDVLSDAVDSMIENLNRKSPVLGWLLEYIEEQIENDKRWDVSKDIKKFGENIFNEEYIEKGDGLRKKLSDPTFIPDFRKRLKQKLEDATEIMKGFCEQFDGILDTNGLTINDFSYQKNGIASYFNKLKRGELSDDDILSSRFEKFRDYSDPWVPKSVKGERRNTIIGLVDSELRPLVIDAEKMRPIQKQLSTPANLL